MKHPLVVGTILAVILSTVFLWPTPYTYTTYEQQTKTGSKIIVEVRTSRFTNEEETRWNGGKWSPGRVIID